MLASLLPGLRDVRTPLTVGYLWLLCGWLIWGEHFPLERPEGEGSVALLFDLKDMLGPAVGIAALSLLAYVLGAMLTISLESHVITDFVSKTRAVTPDSRATAMQYRAFLDRMTKETLEEPARRLKEMESEITELRSARGYARSALETMEADLASDPTAVAAAKDDLEGMGAELSELLTAHHYMVSELAAVRSAATPDTISVADLKVRLLVANQEMYGEHDRLASEAAFRVNLCPPLLVLGFLVASETSWWWILLTLAVVGVLLVQGAIRLMQSVTVLRRAVLANVLTIPSESPPPAEP